MTTQKAEPENTQELYDLYQELAIQQLQAEQELRQLQKQAEAQS